jgi:myo-inositol-1(or 4)-monophosphatase
MQELAEILKPVEGIAREAGDILMDYYGEIRHIDYKGIGDIVTEADKASEKLITERLESRFPDYAILGEEFGMSEVQSDNCWVTDPLDGTANYAARCPIFAVAIGLLHNGTPVLGLVFDPTTDRMFSAVKGGGATLNGIPIHVNDREKLDPIGLFGFGSPVLEMLHPFIQKCGKGRSLGSAALHICSVATGYFDGSLDFYTKLWDIAAAAVILQEAGGIMTHPSGAPLFPLSSESSAYQGHDVPFLATNGRIHEECLNTLEENKDNLQP